MSRPSSKNNKFVFGVPGGSNIPQSSQSATGESKTMLSSSKTNLDSRGKSRKPNFSIPTIHVSSKEIPIDPVLEKLKRRTIRQNTAEGEDLKGIKEIVRSLQNEVVTVQDFVGLISPYTGDNGNALRAVMGDDLLSFRNMAKRVYDTLTQDVTDVLANEQINLTDYYNERYSMYMDKMMHVIDEIYQYAPNFDFELYYDDPSEYLSRLFPTEVNHLRIDEDESQRRQEAYYKLQWLHSKANKFRKENGQLQAQLKDAKKQQQEVIKNLKKQEEMAELRRTHLEATQCDLQNQLKKLDESDTFRKSQVITENEHQLIEDEPNAKDTSNQQDQEPRVGTPVRPPSEPWHMEAAKMGEGEKLHTSATSTELLECCGSKTGVKNRKLAKSKVKFKKQPEARNKPVCSAANPKFRQLSKEKEGSSLFYLPSRPPSSSHSPKRSRCGYPVTDLPKSSVYFTEQASQNKHCSVRKQPASKDVWDSFR